MKRNIILRKIVLELYSNAKNDLDDAFFIKLKEIAQSHKMNPADLLLVMYSESGLNPAAINGDGGAVGIGQFMPFVLHNLGWKGTNKEFAKLSAAEQLDYMGKLIESNMKFNGGKSFDSAAQYYQSHFLPASLSRGSSFDTIIADGRPGMAKEKWEKSAYDHNPGFDADKKGFITVGDLDKLLKRREKEPAFQNLLSKLNSVSSSNFNVSSVEESNNDESSNDGSQISDTLNVLNNYLDSVLSSSNEKIIKKAFFKKNLPENNMLIYVDSNNFNASLEFSRILCIAFDEELLSSSSIYSNGKNIEISLKIYGEKNLCIDATEQLCNNISDAFETATRNIGEFKINTFINYGEKPSCLNLDPKVAERNYRIFHLKFIGKNNG